MDWAKKTVKARKLLFKPGTSLWLAHHNVSMAFRRVQRGHEGLSVWGIIGLVVLILVAIIPISIGTFWGIKSGGISADKSISNIATMLMILFMVTGISTSLMSMVENYTDRGDLDLLLTSPIRIENIVAARLYASIWRDFSLYFSIAFVALFLPILLINIKYLWFVPAIIGFSLFLSSFAFIIGQGILQIFGPNKGRKIVRGMGAIISIAWILFLVFQRSIFSKYLKASNLEANTSPNFNWFGRAFAGEFLPALTLLAIGVLSFLIVKIFAAKSFGVIAAKLMGGSDESQTKEKQNQDFKFKTNFPSSLLFKEWRVMRRDPMTYIQAFAPVVGLLPAMVQGFQKADGSFAFRPEIYPPIAAIAAGQIVLALAWVAVSLEDANDLLTVSPKKPRDIIMAKAISVMLPGFIIIGAFSLLCAANSISMAIICAIFGTLSIFSSALIEFLRPRPTKRVRLTQRPDRSMISVFVSLGLSISWGLGAHFATKGNINWWIPTLIGAVVLSIAVFTSPKLKKHGLKNAFLHY